MKELDGESGRTDDTNIKWMSDKYCNVYERNNFKGVL